jgi:energy-coupling factor transporter ATP-binding protein EcfA2
MSRPNFKSNTIHFIGMSILLMIIFSFASYLILGITFALVVFMLMTIWCYWMILKLEELPNGEIVPIRNLEWLENDSLYTVVQIPKCPDPAKIFNYEGLLFRLEDERFQEFILNNIKDGHLTVLPILYGDIGVSVDGETLVYGDLTQAPSLLIAGISGSGKSTLLHQILSVLLTYNNPNNLELYLCDTKRVELNRYANFPHTKRIIYDHEQVEEFLDTILREINERYEYLDSVNITSIAEYNNLKLGENMRMPFVVVVIEELGDIMLGSNKEVQHKLIKILQKGRAAGVHVITLTQRPSASIINSSIKANIPNRVALRVSSATDSRIILEQPGAEGLIHNKGEMFVLDGGRLKYAISVVVTKEEIDKLRKAWQ